LRAQQQPRNKQVDNQSLTPEVSRCVTFFGNKKLFTTLFISMGAKRLTISELYKSELETGFFKAQVFYKKRKQI
jgi:hypothetical protein